MANPYFQFKQFTVWHDKCAMKVGTDGVLLGAWADLSEATRVLDVGTGTGLIALMLAQRSDETVRITALDIDADAALQATENADRSPWKERIEVVKADFKDFETEQPFDLIVSNPPYFVNSLQCPDKQRTTARHTDSLPFDNLLEHSTHLLTERGRLALIIPTEVWPLVERCATNHGLYPHRVVKVVTTPGATPKRMLVCFHRHAGECIEQQLLVEKSRHVYSDEFTALAKDFYLKL